MAAPFSLIYSQEPSEEEPTTEEQAVDSQPGKPSAADVAVPYAIDSVDLPETLSGRVAAVDVAPNGDILLLTRSGEVHVQLAGKEDWHPWSLHGLEGASGLLADYWPKSIYVVHATGISRLFDTDKDATSDFVKASIPAWRFSTLGRLFLGSPVAFPEGDLLLAPNVTEGAWSSVLMRVPEAKPAIPWIVSTYHFANPSPAPGDEWLLAGQSRRLSPEAPDGPLSSGVWFWSSQPVIEPSIDAEESSSPTPTPEAEEGEESGRETEEEQENETEASSEPEESPVPRETRSKSPSPLVLGSPHIYIPAELLPTKPLPPAQALIEGENNFGVFSGQIFLGSRNSPQLLRIMPDRGGNRNQGAVTDFARLGGDDTGLDFLHFDTLGNRLFLGQRGHLLSIRSTDQTPHAVRHLRQASDGMEVHFTVPVDRSLASDPASWKVTRLSESKEEQALRFDSDSRLVIDFDGLAVTWQTDEIAPDSLYRFDLGAILSESGQRLSHGAIYYTTGPDNSRESIPEVSESEKEIDPPDSTQDPVQDPETEEAQEDRPEPSPPSPEEQDGTQAAISEGASSETPSHVCEMRSARRE